MIVTDDRCARLAQPTHTDRTETMTAFFLLLVGGACVVAQLQPTPVTTLRPCPANFNGKFSALTTNDTVPQCLNGTCVCRVSCVVCRWSGGRCAPSILGKYSPAHVTVFARARSDHVCQFACSLFDCT